jgi:hypothetical protein
MNIQLRSLVLLALPVITTAVLPCSSALAQGGAEPQSDEARLEREWARRHLMDVVISGFRKLVNQRTPAYETWKAHKAGAACITWPNNRSGGVDPYIPIWGGGWEYDTADEAAQRAMTECESGRGNRLNAPSECKCELLYRENDVVLEPPAEVIAASVAWLRRRAPPTMCSNWLVASKPGLIDLADSCPVYSDRSVEDLKFVIKQIPPIESLDSPDIFPAPPAVRQSEIDSRRLTHKEDGKRISRKVWFNPPIDSDPYVETWTTPFTPPAGKVYYFALHRVPPDRVELVLSALKNLERSKMYGRFQPKLKPGVTVPYFNESDELARYTRAYDLTDQEVYDAFYLQPESSHDGLLYGERSTRLWVEGVIPIDQNWIPVAQPLRSVTPIAVQTDRALYLYSIETRLKGSAGPGMEIGFEGRVLDLSACADINVCLKDAARVLSEELTKAFQQAPLSAAPVHRLAPPTQVRFQRLTEASAVLQGMAGPYFEMSTYTATFWPAPRDSFAGSPNLYFTTQNDPRWGRRVADQIFLQVEHSLQISVGRKGSYEEPTRDQYAAYERAVTAAVQSAIVQATERLGGAVGADGAGVIPAKKGTP